MNPQTIAIIALVVNLVVGIVFCFFGNRWLKAIVAVYGFVLGFLVANSVLPMFTSISDLATILISLGIGVIGALLFVFFLYAGVFFIGFGAGVLLCLLIIDVFGLNVLDWYIYVPTVIIGCILGALTLNKRRIFLSIFTAYIGASALAIFVYSLVNGIDAQILTSYSDPAKMFGIYSSTEYLIALAVLFVAGLVIQLTLTSAKKDKKT